MGYLDQCICKQTSIRPQTRMKKYVGWFLRLGLALAWFSSHSVRLDAGFEGSFWLSDEEDVSRLGEKKLQYQIYAKAFFYSFDAKCITILYFHFTSLALAMKLHFALLHFKPLTTWDCRNLSNNHCRIQNWLKTKWVITAVLHCTHNINIYTF